jgi:hypothetical protein
MSPQRAKTTLLWLWVPAQRSLGSLGRDDEDFAVSQGLTAVGRRAIAIGLATESRRKVLKCLFD